MSLLCVYVYILHIYYYYKTITDFALAQGGRTIYSNNKTPKPRVITYSVSILLS